MKEKCIIDPNGKCSVWKMNFYECATKAWFRVVKDAHETDTQIFRTPFKLANYQIFLLTNN